MMMWWGLFPCWIFPLPSSRVEAQESQEVVDVKSFKSRWEDFNKDKQASKLLWVKSQSFKIILEKLSTSTETSSAQQQIFIYAEWQRICCCSCTWWLLFQVCNLTCECVTCYGKSRAFTAACDRAPLQSWTWFYWFFFALHSTRFCICANSLRQLVTRFNFLMTTSLTFSSYSLLGSLLLC